MLRPSERLHTHCVQGMAIVGLAPRAPRSGPLDKSTVRGRLRWIRYCSRPCSLSRWRFSAFSPAVPSVLTSRLGFRTGLLAYCLLLITFYLVTTYYWGPLRETLGPLIKNVDW